MGVSSASRISRAPSLATERSSRGRRAAPLAQLLLIAIVLARCGRPLDGAVVLWGDRIT